MSGTRFNSKITITASQYDIIERAVRFYRERHPDARVNSVTHDSRADICTVHIHALRSRSGVTTSIRAVISVIGSPVVVSVTEAVLS